MTYAQAAALESDGFLDIAGHRLHYQFHRAADVDAPALVLLHEGLGSVAMWGDWPLRLAQATQAHVFVYSRAGYGRSSPVALPRPLTYMKDEAQQVVPLLLDRLGFSRIVLVGHSDGGSIAAIYAGLSGDQRIRGLCLMAPHFFNEDICVAAIAQAKIAYETGDLKRRLARYHDNVDVAFYGWNGAWLDPEFLKWNIEEFLPGIRVSALVIQSDNDPYGTIKQVESIQHTSGALVTAAIIKGIGHSPHRDAADQTLHLIPKFCGEIFAPLTAQVGISS